MELIEHNACFGGTQNIYKHHSHTLNCEMRFGVYLPPTATTEKLPVLYWLSGLTCTEQNFITKAGAQRYAAQHNIIIVTPDTSPRGDDVADIDSYDLGKGASFYVNATEKPWCTHYQMYDYILNELPALIAQNFPVTAKKSICGHSMGGHGALILALKNPSEYISVSAFAPIVSPSQVEWGCKALSIYLGSDKETWKEYDAVELILNGNKVPEILIDQGLADPFYEKQLQTKRLEHACHKMHINALIRYHKNYDHSYYFISSFIGEHIAYHANRLGFNK